jgi:cytochrome b involved in lipid metabolism
MYKYKVYDVSRLLHPGGNSIIEKVQGEEISRYLHGAYGLESTLLPAHSHSVYAYKLLDEHYIG